MGARSDDSNDEHDMRQHKKKQRTIRNPYQKRPSLLPPISTKPIYGISAVAQASANNSSHVAAALSLKAPPSTTTTASAAAATSPPSHDTNQLALDNTTNPQQSTNDTFSTSTYQGAVSISLPPWQRLPSRNLSFGSAEILSITECVRGGAAALYQGRSIRCTGVLKQVVMGQQEGANAQHTILSCVSPPPFLAVRLSDPLHRHNDRNTKEPNGPQLWVIFPTFDATAAIHATPVGSAVTVLGEPVPLKHPHGEWGLCARLSLTVAPTTNLALEWQALQLRRRYLLSNSVVCNRQQERNNDHKEVLQAGCGPPPYHH